MQLRVWQDARDYYVLTCRVFSTFAYELKKVAAQAIACADSVHRNIAEGYCRRSIKEYINFLNIARGSIGESVPGVHSYRKAGQICDEDFDLLDALACKIENGMIKLIEGLEAKKASEDWVDTLILRDCDDLYAAGAADWTQTY
ncbi:four helix bundle protein [bacterium]|nr:four helix bundle protein [bacterium]